MGSPLNRLQRADVSYKNLIMEGKESMLRYCIKVLIYL